MTCPACTTAEENPQTGLYHSDCIGCKERAIAQGIPFHEADAVGRMTAEYKRMMFATFGEDWQTNGAHQRIKEWKKRIRRSA